MNGRRGGAPSCLPASTPLRWWSAERHRRLRAVVDDVDVERVAIAGKGLAPAASAYLEEDFIINLLETVLDYQTHTTAVVRALEYFRANRWNDVRTLDDLDATLSSYPDDQQGNTALAGYLWGNRHWTRARPPANPVDRAAEPWREHPA